MAAVGEAKRRWSGGSDRTTQEATSLRGSDDDDEAWEEEGAADLHTLHRTSSAASAATAADDAAEAAADASTAAAPAVRRGASGGAAPAAPGADAFAGLSAAQHALQSLWPRAAAAAPIDEATLALREQEARERALARGSPPYLPVEARERALALTGSARPLSSYAAFPMRIQFVFSTASRRHMRGSRRSKCRRSGCR